MKAYIGIGIPGSGKTTLLKPLAEKEGLIYINRDDIREELTGDPTNHTREPLVNKLMFERMSEGLRGNGIVLDATHSKRADRVRSVAFCRQHGAEQIIGYYVKVPLATALKRNAARVRKVPEPALELMQNRLDVNPPSLEEGFNEIIEIID